MADDDDEVSKSQPAEGNPGPVSHTMKLAASGQGLVAWDALTDDLKDTQCTLASARGTVISSDISNDSDIIGKQQRTL